MAKRKKSRKKSKVGKKRRKTAKKIGFAHGRGGKGRVGPRSMKAHKTSNLMPLSVIEKHAKKLKRNARAAAVYRKVLSV